MKKHILLAALVVTFLNQGGYTSDKGIRAEIVEGTSALFCTTSILADLKPLVDKKRFLATAKMTSKDLNHEKQRLDAMWKEIIEKHKTAAAAVLSGRLHSPTYHDDYLQEISTDVWQKTKTRCQDKLSDSVGEEYASEFLHRYFQTESNR